QEVNKRRSTENLEEFDPVHCRIWDNKRETYLQETLKGIGIDVENFVKGKIYFFEQEGKIDSQGAAKKRKNRW
ncbi:MAG: hypothetical protein JXD19_06520, partial [Deltaproteobacteria bacterium]|nr:hypothetical protein [Deltaproteobacteria bacterium]